MTTVYRYKFIVNAGMVVYESRLHHLEHTSYDSTWNSLIARWEGRIRDEKKEPYGTLFYAEAMVEEDGSFKVV